MLKRFRARRLDPCFVGRNDHREYALLLRHPEPRPWLVCVHGTEMGRAPVDPALFRAWKLHDQLGLNVVMPVLPMHGLRARGLPIRLQEPESLIGLNSLSLGG